MPTPAKPPKTERFALMFSKPMIEQIDDWGIARRIRTRAETIRSLVRIGIETDRQIRLADKATTGRPSES